MADKKQTMLRKGLNRVRKDVADMVAHHGWAVLSIHADVDTPPYSYTVGLTEKGLPEIILFGVPPDAAQPVLEILAKELVDGKSYGENTPLTRVFAGVNAYLKPVPEIAAREKMWLASEFYPKRMAGLQLVWPDEAGVFPWQDGFNENLRLAQPLLFHRSLH